MSKQVSDALRLCVITVAAGFALGGIYMITKEPIAAQEIKAQQEAYRAVLGAAEEFEELAGEEYTKEKIGLSEEILMEIEDKKGFKDYKSC